LDEIFVAADAASGDFMPVLLVSLVRRGRKQQRSTVFSLS
jgi:hypothetical protein